MIHFNTTPNSQAPAAEGKTLFVCPCAGASIVIDDCTQFLCGQLVVLTVGIVISAMASLAFLA